MIALDLSRLLSRAGRGTPTGIDRVELAYAEHLIASGHPCCFAARDAGRQADAAAAPDRRGFCPRNRRGLARAARSARAGAAGAADRAPRPPRAARRKRAAAFRHVARQCRRLRLSAGLASPSRKAKADRSPENAQPGALRLPDPRSDPGRVSRIREAGPGGEPPPPDRDRGRVRRRVHRELGGDRRGAAAASRSRRPGNPDTGGAVRRRSAGRRGDRTPLRSAGRISSVSARSRRARTT